MEQVIPVELRPVPAASIGPGIKVLSAGADRESPFDGGGGWGSDRAQKSVDPFPIILLSFVDADFVFGEFDDDQIAGGACVTLEFLIDTISDPADQFAV